ncbi:MAG: hypothetical protein AAGC44_09850 [Planctomycetota bacterium]
MRLLLIPPLVMVACLFAGLYGMAHDQLSYTLSPDYFHHLKFEQFGIWHDPHVRVGVAQVGWMATWWMGLCIGAPLTLAGLMVPGIAPYARAVIKSFVIAIATAAITGAIGLAVAIPFPVEELYAPNAPFPAGVSDREAFLEVGVMHNASYLGGGIGLLVAIAYLLHTGLRQRKTAAMSHTDRQSLGD